MSDRHTGIYIDQFILHTEKSCMQFRQLVGLLHFPIKCHMVCTCDVLCVCTQVWSFPLVSWTHPVMIFIE